jgi:hypothetical protein
MQILVCANRIVHANPRKSVAGCRGTGQVDCIKPNNLNGGTWGKKELRHPNYWILRVPKINSEAAIKYWQEVLESPQQFRDDVEEDEPTELWSGIGTNNPVFEGYEIYRRRRYVVSLHAMNPDKANHLLTHRNRFVDLSPNEFREAVVESRWVDAYDKKRGDPYLRVINDIPGSKHPPVEHLTIPDLDNLMEERRWKKRDKWRNKDRS